MPDRELKVFVMWQGAAGRAARDALRKEYDQRAAAHDQRGLVAGWKVTYLDVISEFDRTLGTDVLTCTEELIKECDCAIALHATDQRAGSEGPGNLWFEIGCWYGFHGPNHCLVAPIESSSGSSAKMPSDLLGVFVSDPQPFPGQQPMEAEAMFKPRDGANASGLGDELWDQFDAFTRKQCGRLSGKPQAHSSASAKVGSTLGHSAERWLQEQIAACQKDHAKNCGCAQESLTFVAELLRIQSTARELAQLAGSLHTLAAHAVEMLNSDRTKGRLDALEEVRETLLELTKFEQTLRRKSDEKYQDTWTRLMHFFTWRLEEFQTDQVRRLQLALRHFPEVAKVFTAPDIAQAPFFRTRHAVDDGTRDKADNLGEYSQ